MSLHPHIVFHVACSTFAVEAQKLVAISLEGSVE